MMTATVVALPIAQLQSRFLAIRPRIETHARIFFRQVKSADEKAERIAETLAIAWKWFVRLAQRGKDATHYPGYTEPDWFHGGIRPSVFPILVLPQLGLTFHPSRTTAIDLDTGVSISGILTSLGFRVGL